MGRRSQNCADGVTSRPAEADAANAGEGLAQQLRPSGGYRRANAESWANHLWLSEPHRVIRRRSSGRQEGSASGRRRQSRDRTAGQEIDLRNGAGRKLFGLGDDAAGDARGSTAAGAAGYGVNDNRGPAIAEDGVSIRAESYIGSDGARVGCAVRSNDQSKVRDIASGHSLVGVSAAKMRSGGLEVGRLTLGHLMNVEGVLTRREILDIEGYFDALGRGRESRSADALALCILDVNSDGLCGSLT